LLVVAAKAGIKRIDSNLFLEQWIPFDPSNISVENGLQPQYQKDQINGRFADWNGAPADWSIYHPSLYDWRMKGNANRVIARVMNLKARHRSITIEEIEKAFIKAENGENVYLGVTNHDWRDMSLEINEFRGKLELINKKYPHVSFKFSETVEAFRSVLGYSEQVVEHKALDLKVELNRDQLSVDLLRGGLFGPQPYLAFKTITGDFFS
jgi:hypothetical protein